MLSSNDVGKPLPSSEFTWTDREAILYALGVGAGRDDLSLVYEGGDFVVLPTFGVVPAFPAFAGLGRVLDFDHRMTLHGRQRIELHRPIPPEGTVTTSGVVDQIWDKGKAAVLVAKIDCVLADGERLLTAESTAFVRNGGGFGGERGPATEPWTTPDRDADLRFDTRTSADQALLYRLSGDRNPLHADPAVAQAVGFDQPILHGLCTYGAVGRVAFGALAGGDPAKFRSLECRFAGVVYPGETLVTSIWIRDETTANFVTRVADRDTVALDDGTIVLNPST